MIVARKQYLTTSDIPAIPVTPLMRWYAASAVWGCMRGIIQIESGRSHRVGADFFEAAREAAVSLPEGCRLGWDGQVWEFSIRDQSGLLIVFRRENGEHFAQRTCLQFPHPLGDSLEVQAQRAMPSKTSGMYARYSEFVRRGKERAYQDVLSQIPKIEGPTRVWPHEIEHVRDDEALLELLGRISRNAEYPEPYAIACGSLTFVKHRANKGFCVVCGKEKVRDGVDLIGGMQSAGSFAELLDNLRSECEDRGLYGESRVFKQSSLGI